MFNIVLYYIMPYYVKLHYIYHCYYYHHYYYCIYIYIYIYICIHTMYIYFLDPYLVFLVILFFLTHYIYFLTSFFGSLFFTTKSAIFVMLVLEGSKSFGPRGLTKRRWFQLSSTQPNGYLVFFLPAVLGCASIVQFFKVCFPGGLGTH